jgi:hypothetical protein
LRPSTPAAAAAMIECSVHWAQFGGRRKQTLRFLNIGFSFLAMTGSEVIEAIKRMPREERLKVIQYARHAEKEQLSADELETLLRKMVETSDPAAKAKLKEEFMHGFYGTEVHA